MNSLVSIIGPTAIGKTAVAIELARHFSSEIISADSRQFFREMEIGTAVPSEEELASVKHHFIGHKSIFENYSVGDFEREAIQNINGLFKKHDILFLVGGSGLYVDAISKGLDDFPKTDPKIREGLNQRFQEEGLKPLQEELKKRDPEYHGKVDLENPHRLIRALEICIGTGKPYSSFLNQKKEKRPFQTLKIGLDAPRETIYSRIEKRVDMMMENGLLEEAKRLLPHKNLNALNTVGYKELFQYLEGEISLESAVSEIKKNTRRFAKRQMTWFKKDPEITWFPYDGPVSEIIGFIGQKTSSRP
jgi:tRNA dimethylallyltransferase